MAEIEEATIISKWRQAFKVHPAAELFPRLSGEELTELTEDIKKSGLKEQIYFWSADGQDFVLDGINRLDALESAGVEIDSTSKLEDLTKHLPGSIVPGYRFYTLGDPFEFVVSRNIHRRHLTKEKQAELIVAVAKAREQELSRNDCEKLKPKRAAHRPKDPVKQTAIEMGKRAGISPRTIESQLAKDKTRPKIERKAAKVERKLTPVQSESRPIKPQALGTVGAVSNLLAAAAKAVEPPKIAPPAAKPVVEPPTVKPVEESLSFTDPAFKGGNNSYNVTFKVDGARASTVKKRIVELFPDCADEVTVENAYAKTSRAAQLSEAQSIVEDLRDGLQEWRDNLPENFQEKAEQLDECIQALESIIGEMESLEFPSAFGS